MCMGATLITSEENLRFWMRLCDLDEVKDARVKELFQAVQRIGGDW